jgi:hypothetical protein
MAAPFLTSRALVAAATLRLPVSSVAPVASGYEHSLRPREPGVSPAQGAICSKGDR